MAFTSYGDISPRTAAFAVAEILKRALPYLVLEKFGQAYPLPNNSTKTAKFRRYEALAKATTPLIEGVTPAGKTLTYTDYTANLQQYGDYVPLTDVIADTHEDQVFSAVQDIISEQAAQTIEAVRFGILKGGTNVFYAYGANSAITARASVKYVPVLADQRRVTRSFKRQNARYITKVTSASANYGTTAVQAAYIGLIHPDLENDVRNMTGFQNSKDYGSATPTASEFEIGAVEDVRYIRSTVFESFPIAGAAIGSDGMVSSDGIKNDVYPILYLAADSWGMVPLKGKDSLTPIVLNPGKPSDSDPLGQRGYVGWKAMTTAVILNELWVSRLECSAKDI